MGAQSERGVRGQGPWSGRAVWTTSLHVGAFLAIVWALWNTRTILAWVLIALLLALALDPLVQLVQRSGLRRGWSILAVSLLMLGVIALFFVSFVPMLVDQGTQLVENAPQLLQRLREYGPVAWAEERFGLLQKAQVQAQRHAVDAAGGVLTALRGLAEALLAAVTTLVLALFMLLFGPDLYERGMLWLSPEQQPRVRRLVRETRQKVGGYVAGTGFIASIGAVVTTVTLLVLGVPYFLPLGMAMLLLGVIPYIGPVLGGVLITVATFATEGLTDGLIALGVFWLYQQAENHLLQPLIQRRTIQMNPLLIALVMLFGTSLAGILGALVALPIAGAAQVVFQDLLRRRQSRWEAAAVSRGPKAPPVSTGAEPSPHATPASGDSEVHH